LLYFLDTVSGPLIDTGLFRLLIVIGSACQVLGVFTTSGISQYWQLILAQGIVQGIGNGLYFTPCIAVVSTYFAKRGVLAMAFTACGAPAGGIVFPIVSERIVFDFPLLLKCRLPGS
jgi:MFS family permease